MLDGSLRKTPMWATGFLFTKTLPTDTTFLGDSHGDGSLVHVSPGAGDNISPAAMTTCLFTNTLRSGAGGASGAGGVTQGQTPPLSTPVKVATGLPGIVEFSLNLIYFTIQLVN